MPKELPGPGQPIEGTNLLRIVTDYFTGKPPSEFARKVFAEAEKLKVFQDKNYSEFLGLINAIESGDKDVVNELLKIRVPL